MCRPLLSSHFYVIAHFFIIVYCASHKKRYGPVFVICLTFNTVWANAAEDKQMIFSENRLWNFMHNKMSKPFEGGGGGGGGGGGE